MKKLGAITAASALALGVFAGSLASAATPTITLNSASAKGSKLSVKVTVKGLKLAPGLVGKAKKAGFGHYHLFVNGKYVGFAATPSATIVPAPAIKSGKTYRITVQLANNDHSPIGKASKVIVVKDK
jgi:hypothetical protein